MHDVIIIGAGPAGISAAIFCARAQLKTLVVGVPEKSQLFLARNIENYFGFPGPINGPDLLDLGIKQAKKFGAEFLEEEIVSIKKNSDNFILETEEVKNLTTKSVIIATGIPIILSGIKNEQEFTGKGVHYCVSCDGPFFKNRRIVIIGNGNNAAEDAVEATSYSHDITIISNSNNFEFSENFEKEIEKFKIKLVNRKIVEFIGDKFLKGLKFEDGEIMETDGVFMACGTTNALEFAGELGIEVRDNIIVVDENSMTNIQGIFAAGNCMGKCRQIAKNVGDGCNAAVSVIKYLKMRELKAL